MQGLKENAAVGAIVKVRHLGGRIIEPFVAPSVIAGKHGISRFYRALQETASNLNPHYLVQRIAIQHCNFNADR